MRVRPAAVRYICFAKSSGLRSLGCRCRFLLLYVPWAGEFGNKDSRAEPSESERCFCKLVLVSGLRRSAGHVFLSYAREDAAHGDRLQRTLEAVGILVWRDTADLWLGQDWRANIGPFMRGLVRSARTGPGS